MGWKNNTPGDCCCVVDDSCPCEEGTLINNRDLIISGVINLTPANEENLDMNRTIPDSDIDLFENNCGLTGSAVSTGFDNWFESLQLIFTRLIVFTVSVTDIILPPGVKVVAVLNASIGNPFTDQTTAVFFKVLDNDPNAFVDCNDEITGFTFDRHITPPPSRQVFNATNASISYI
jgi:hypothetical protein